MSAATASRGEPSRPRSTAPPAPGGQGTAQQAGSGSAEDRKRKKILVLGSRKAGKSSCVKTIFQQVAPKDTAFFGITQKVEMIDYDTMVPLQIWDTPANFEVEQLEVPLGSFSTIIYVLDIQQDDQYHNLITRFINIMVRAHLANPSMKYAIFIHKAEVLSEDYRGENYAEVQRIFNDELEDFNYHSLAHLAPNGNLSDTAYTQSLTNNFAADTKLFVTSIYDVTLRDAWSAVILEVMEVATEVERLLFGFSESSGMDNTYLFDIRSQVVLATDNKNKNEKTLAQATDYLVRFLQFRDLYKDLRYQHADGDAGAEDANARSNGHGGPSQARRPSGAGTLDTLDHAAGLGGSDWEDENDEDGEAEPSGWWDEEDPSAQWMTQATRLMPNTMIALWQFTPSVALVALLRADIWQEKRGMIEYNLTFLRQGVRRILMEV